MIALGMQYRLRLLLDLIACQGRLPTALAVQSLLLLLSIMHAYVLAQHTLLQVLVGAHALLANGGVMAGAGNQLTAMAAKHHAVPFVVLVGLQKLSPLFPHDPSVSFNDYKVNPLRILRAP